MSQKQTGEIRLRVCLAVVREDRILLVPHFFGENNETQWVIPGGQVKYGESLEETARREFFEETGYTAQAFDFLDVSQVILPEKPWHSVTITFRGHIIEGELSAEAGHRYGIKLPRWFSASEVQGLWAHPKSAVEKSFTQYSDKIVNR